MSKLRYSITVQFDINAGDTETLEYKLAELYKLGALTQIKAKSAGVSKKEPKEE